MRVAYHEWMDRERTEEIRQEMMGLQQLLVRLTPLKVALVGHALYREIDSPAALRLFMEYHVFAVWDFMSLLKSLQRRLCCVEVPWLPAADAQLARFVNKLVP